MKALVFGSNGQVGRELARASWPTGWQPVFLSRANADLANLDSIDGAIADQSPAIVINAAAYTSVDAAEDDEALAFAINAAAPGRMAECCRQRSIPLFHISTDYVFDGRKSAPYVEGDAVAPLGAYGRTKAAGEAVVRATAPEHLILRTAWVFSSFGKNFVKTMLRLAPVGNPVRVVRDQLGSPTAAEDLARALIHLVSLYPDLHYGTFHLAGAGETSWYGFAQEIFDDLERRTGHRPRCVPISTSQYVTKAPRPANSRLDCSKFLATFGFAMSAWQDSLACVLDELHGSSAPNEWGSVKA